MSRCHRAFRSALSWAQRQAEVREDAIADMGLGYPVLRMMARELGAHFVHAGVISKPEDIFWLKRAEVEAAVADLEGANAPLSHEQRVQERQATWQAQKKVVPPVSLPPSKKYMGFDVEMFTGVGEGTQEGNVLKGVGGNKSRAAEVLGIGRRTLYDKIARHGLNGEQEANLPHV